MSASQYTLAGLLCKGIKYFNPSCKQSVSVSGKKATMICA